MEDESRKMIEELMRDPRSSARLTLGCVLTLSVLELVQGGMPPQDVHDIVDLTAKYGVPDEKTVSTVWVFLLAYAAKGLSQIDVGLPEVHQAVEGSVRQVAALQSGARP